MIDKGDKDLIAQANRALFVGGFEMVRGLFVMCGLLTPAAAVPLLIVISSAIVTTKIPELFRAGQGF